MQVMCALVANDPAKQNWLRSAGLLQVLHRLTLGAQPQGEDDISDDASSAPRQHVSLSVRRQCARILAILAQQQDALVSSDAGVQYGKAEEDCLQSLHRYIGHSSEDRMGDVYC